MNIIDTSNRVPFELKGSVLTVLVLHLKQTDPECLYPQLAKKIGQAQNFFRNAPVLVDLSAVDETEQAALDIMLLADTLRSMGMVPVGVRGNAAGLIDRILQAGLGLLPTVKTEKSVTATSDPQIAEPEQPAREDVEPLTAVPSQGPAGTSTKVISQPVRSGQQVFAPEGDLVLLSSVNAGAEVLAAGSIHVYGALRGRAMAGIHGDAGARIFSLQCNAELVAIAGEYVVNESLNEAVINKSVIISLKNGALDFQLIGSFSQVS